MFKITFLLLTALKWFLSLQMSQASLLLLSIIPIISKMEAYIKMNPETTPYLCLIEVVKLSLCTQAPTHPCFLLWRVLLQPAVNPICIQKRQQGPLFIGLPLLKRTVYWLQKGLFSFKLINSCFSPKLYPRDWFLSVIHTTPQSLLQTPSKSF